MALYGASKNPKEIEYLLGNTNLSSENIEKLGSIDLSNHTACEACLNEINDSLAELSIIMASKLEIDLSNLRLTRISPTIQSYLSENSQSIQSINLMGNHITDLSFLLKINFPNIQIVNLNNNPINSSQVDDLIVSMPFAQILSEIKLSSILPTKKELTSYRHLEYHFVEPLLLLLHNQNL